MYGFRQSFQQGHRIHKCSRSSSSLVSQYLHVAVSLMFGIFDLSFCVQTAPNRILRKIPWCCALALLYSIMEASLLIPMPMPVA